MQPTKPTPDMEPRYIWVLRKSALSGDSLPNELEGYVKRYEVIKETPMGYRVKINYSQNGTVITHEKYDVFQSEKDLLEFIADKANKAADMLDKRKLYYTRLLCDAHDAMRDLAAK